MILVLFLLKGRIKQRKLYIIYIKIHFSVAIMAYLSDKHKKHDWYPTELQERARVNEYSHWQHLNLRANGAMLFQTKVERKLSTF
jgi:hypothetical protein